MRLASLSILACATKGICEVVTVKRIIGHITVPLKEMMWCDAPCPTYIEVPFSARLWNVEDRIKIWIWVYTMLELLSKESGKDLRSYRSVSEMFEKTYQMKERSANF